MSGPFGVHMTLISGRQKSGEIVVAAATFLSMGFLTVDCACTDQNARVEFLTALRRFTGHAGISSHKSPDFFMKAWMEPDDTLSTAGLFWLALDKEGERLARDIFRANGDSPDARVYRSVHKLNLLEPSISPPPDIPFPVEGRQGESGGEQEVYFAWFESLYEAILPWRGIIKNIQSDFS